MGKNIVVQDGLVVAVRNTREDEAAARWFAFNAMQTYLDDQATARAEKAKHNAEVEERRIHRMQAKHAKLMDQWLWERHPTAELIDQIEELEAKLIAII